VRDEEVVALLVDARAIAAATERVVRDESKMGRLGAPREMVDHRAVNPTSLDPPRRRDRAHERDDERAHQEQEHDREQCRDRQDGWSLWLGEDAWNGPVSGSVTP
jgi:hypothetical protein